MIASNLLLQAALATGTSAAVLMPRQAHGSSTSSPFNGLIEILENLNGKNPVEVLKTVLPTAKVANVLDLQPRLRTNSKRVDIRFGPYTLAGQDEPKPKSLINSLDPKGQTFTEMVLSGLCTNCTVLTGKNRITFEDGSEAGPVEGIYLHHFVSRDFTKPPTVPVSRCGDGQTMTRSPFDNIGSSFLVQGEDSVASGLISFTSQDGSYNSGYFLGKDIGLLMQVDLVNYNKESKKVFINFEVEYVDGHVGSDAAATLMSVTGCQQPHQAGSFGSSIKLDPNGVATTDSPKFPVTRDAKIVSANAHMLDGGSKMILLVNGKAVCASEAVYGKGGQNNGETIIRMASCPSGIPIKKGDTIQLQSVYDLATHPLRAGGEHNVGGMADVMGMFYMTFAV